MDGRQRDVSNRASVGPYPEIANCPLVSCHSCIASTIGRRASLLFSSRWGEWEERKGTHGSHGMMSCSRAVRDGIPHSLLGCEKTQTPGASCIFNVLVLFFFSCPSSRWMRSASKTMGKKKTMHVFKVCGHAGGKQKQRGSLIARILLFPDIDMTRIEGFYFSEIT